jgi:hypothetical protein
VKITRELLKKAVEAVDENDALEDIDPVELPDMLWMALRTVQSSEADYKVIMTIEGTIPRAYDVSGLSPEDYGVEISSFTDLHLDIINPHITKLEVR